MKKRTNSTPWVRDWNSWCEEVLTQVRFRPDHPAIYRELMSHMEDNCIDFERIGYEREEAQQKALESMGSAAEVGLALDKAHKSWLGWLWRVSRWLVILALVVAAWGLVFGEAFRIAARKTIGQFSAEEPSANAVEMILSEDYTLWYDPVLAVTEEGENYTVSVSFWAEAKYPWTGYPSWAFWQFEITDDQNSVDEDTQTYITHPADTTDASWTKFQYTYNVVMDHRPEWVELRYPYGTGFVVRAEREVAK